MTYGFPCEPWPWDPQILGVGLSPVISSVHKSLKRSFALCTWWELLEYSMWWVQSIKGEHLKKICFSFEVWLKYDYARRRWSEHWKLLNCVGCVYLKRVAMRYGNVIVSHVVQEPLGNQLVARSHLYPTSEIRAGSINWGYRCQSHTGHALLPFSPNSVYPGLVLFSFFRLCHGACGILVPRPGIEPGPPAVGQPGKSLIKPSAIGLSCSLPIHTWERGNSRIINVQNPTPPGCGRNRNWQHVCWMGPETPAGVWPWRHVTGSGIPKFPAGNSCAQEGPSLTWFCGWWWGPPPSQRGEIYFVGKAMDLLEEMKISFASCEIEVTVLFSPQQGQHQNRKEKQKLQSLW